MCVQLYILQQDKKNRGEKEITVSNSMYVTQNFLKATLSVAQSP